MQQQHAIPTTNTTDQLRISTGAGGVHDAASRTPPAPVLILSWSMVVVVGIACCCCIPCRLALMLLLTFAPCACGGFHQQQLTVVVFLPQPLVQRLHLHPQWFHPLQLAPVVFFSTHWCRYRTYTRATCTVWWLYLVIYIIYMGHGK